MRFCVALIVAVLSGTAWADLTPREKNILKMAHGELRYEIVLLDGKYGTPSEEIGNYFRRVREQVEAKVERLEQAARPEPAQATRQPVRARDRLSMARRNPAPKVGGGPTTEERDQARQARELRMELGAAARERRPLAREHTAYLGDLYVGAVGMLGSAEVFQMAEGGALLRRRGHGDLVWVPGMDKVKMADGDVLPAGAGDFAWAVTGTRRYETVIGGSNTVYELEPVDLDPYYRGLTYEQFEEMLTQAGLSPTEFVELYASTRRQHPNRYVDALVVALRDRLAGDDSEKAMDAKKITPDLSAGG